MIYTINLTERFDNEQKYILLQHGTGDSINNLIAFQAHYEPKDFCLVAPLEQKNLIQFLDQLLQLGFKKVIYFDNSTHGIFNLLKVKFDNFRWVVGMPSGNTGEICDLWSDPYELPIKYPCDQRVLTNKIDRCKDNLLEELMQAGLTKYRLLPNSILIFPTTSTHGAEPYQTLWSTVSDTLNGLNHAVFTNITDKTSYSENVIQGTQPITLDYFELVRLLLANPTLKTISMRSGINDFLRFFANDSLVFFPLEPSWYWKCTRYKHIRYVYCEYTEILTNNSHVGIKEFGKVIVEEFVRQTSGF